MQRLSLYFSSGSACSFSLLRVQEHAGQVKASYKLNVELREKQQKRKEVRVACWPRRGAIQDVAHLLALISSVIGAQKTCHLTRPTACVSRCPDATPAGWHRSRAAFNVWGLCACYQDQTACCSLSLLHPAVSCLLLAVCGLCPLPHASHSCCGSGW